MPLVKDLQVDRDLCVDTFRRREFIIQADFVRREEMGKEVSIRASSMKGEGLIRALRTIAEDDVKIDKVAIEAYENAEDWLCQRMQTVFQSVLHLGFRPTKLPFDRQFYCEGPGGHFIENCNQLAWFPAGAMYAGDERVYIFRVASLRDKTKGYSPIGQIDAKYSGAIGLTKEYLGKFSSELTAYITRLENNAMTDPNVIQAFDRLTAILRPQAYKDEKLKERIEGYKDTNFGGWS